MFNYGNANEAQKEAISATDGLVLITAGPGTGKTFTLVKGAVYLIQECGIKPEQIMMAKEIYFTGMFTSNQGDLSVQYYDPESKRLRKYYPDFLALMEDGSYQLIEVKGDNKIDDEVVLAKKAAAEEMAVASGIHYLMYAGSTLMKSNVLEPTLVVQQASIEI